VVDSTIARSPRCVSGLGPLHCSRRSSRLLVTSHIRLVPPARPPELQRESPRQDFGDSNRPPLLGVCNGRLYTDGTRCRSEWRGGGRNDWVLRRSLGGLELDVGCGAHELAWGRVVTVQPRVRRVFGMHFGVILARCFLRSWSRLLRASFWTRGGPVNDFGSPLILHCWLGSWFGKSPWCRSTARPPRGRSKP
jgi:hypothetical protein